METPPTPASSLFSLDTPEGLTFVASLSRLSPHLVSCHSQSLTASPRHSLGLALISSSSRSRAPRSLRRRQKQTEPVKQHLLHRWVVVVVVFLFHRSLGTSQLELNS
ncbi:uncharacterized protein LOC107605184 isoform X1 [Arachis ipaensis]|uniref:uncharacterized protein LOC107605184 isoform X1 n=1 Tax=Arachis ipaensis TaxID=130454 RepID=UPI000A2B852D|nr:uncharacterized protein LOC107605184 isoform X1 [Arachis ipaensis]